MHSPFMNKANVMIQQEWIPALIREGMSRHDAETTVKDQVAQINHAILCNTDIDMTGWSVYQSRYYLMIL